MTAPNRSLDAIEPQRPGSGRWLVGSAHRFTDLQQEARALTLHETGERGLVVLLSMVARALPLRTALATSWIDGEPRVVALGEAASRRAARSHFLHLPLEGRDGEASGAMQLETSSELGAADLAFARAVATHLGALAGGGAQAHAQRALLASVGRLDGSLTRLASVLSTIASTCVIETTDATWPGSRIVSAPSISSFVPHARIAGLVDRLVALHEAASARRDAPFWSSIPRAPLSEADRALIAQLDLHSILRVPFVTEAGRPAAAVLLGGGDDPPFHSTLLRCVIELVQGGPGLDDNARLYRSALAGVRYGERELSVVSHAVDDPPGSIVTLTDPSLGADPESAQKQLDAVRRAAARLSQLL